MLVRASAVEPSTMATPRNAQPSGEILLNTISSLITGLPTAAALVCLAISGQWRRHGYLTGYLLVSAVTNLSCVAWPELWTPMAYVLLDGWQGSMLALAALQAGRRAFGSVERLPAHAWPIACRKALALVGSFFVVGLMMLEVMPTPPGGHWGFRGLIVADLAVAAVIAETRHAMNLYGVRPDPVVGEALTGLAICRVLQAAAFIFVESSLTVGYGIAWFASFVYVLTMLWICSACRGPR